jgi:hypothetical protein
MPKEKRKCAPGENINHYEFLPSKYIPESIHYPREEELKIKIPSNWILVGPTGSGKTNALFNILKNINGWQRFYLYAKQLEEPLYKYLIDVWEKIAQKTKKPLALIQDNIDSVVDIKDIDKEYSNLVIFDDMIAEDKYKLIHFVGEIYIQIRKVNGTAMFLSQDYYSIPKIIRVNTQYILFRKCNCIRDLKLIMSQYSLGVTLDQLVEMYTESTRENMFDFFLIDMYTTDANLRFRKNFVPIPWKQKFGIPENADFTTGEIKPVEAQLKLSKKQKSDKPQKNASPPLSHQTCPATH